MNAEPSSDCLIDPRFGWSDPDAWPPVLDRAENCCSAAATGVRLQTTSSR